MKKQYYIPTTEITILEAEVVMDGTYSLGGTGTHAQGQAPRRTPVF